MSHENSPLEDIFGFDSADDSYAAELAPLTEFLAGFDILPDVRSKVEREFLRRESLHDVVMDHTRWARGHKEDESDPANAYSRVVAVIQYGMRHAGNFSVNIKGDPRTGKSTIGRWHGQLWWQLKTGHADSWEDHILYDRAYSDSSDRLQELTKQLLAECHDDKHQVLIRLHEFCVILDEQEIEHEEGSTKAIHDVQNLLSTCASSQVPFIFISALNRNIGALYNVWAIGVNADKQANLSLYYDNDGFCHGYLMTPNIPESPRYEETKANTVVDLLATGGRKVAQVKSVNGAPSVPEPMIHLEVTPDADFMTILEQSARQHLLPILKEPRNVDRWLQRYFRGLTFKDIAELEGGGLKADSIGHFLREQQDRISNTLLGAILEEALVAYLNQSVRILPAATPLRPSDVLQQTFHRLGGPGQPDVDAPNGIQINAKLFLEHRSSWQLHCSPEHQSPHGYCVLAQLGPPTPTLHVYPLTPGQDALDTGSVEEVAWDAWLEQLRALTAPLPASSPAASPPPPGD